MAETLRRIMRGLREEFNPTPDMASQPRHLRYLVSRPYNRRREDLVKYGSHIQEVLLELIENRLISHRDKLPLEFRGDISYMAGIITGFSFNGTELGTEEESATAVAAKDLPTVMFSERQKVKFRGEDIYRRSAEVANKMREAGLIREKPFKTGTIAYLTTKIDPFLT